MSAEVAQRLLIISSVSDRCEANLYMSLAAMGFKIWLVCDPADPYEPTYRRAGISVIVRQIKNRFDLRFMFWLRKFIRSQPIDVIYAPTSRGLTAANLVCKRKPLKIVSYRGTLGHLAWWDPAAQLAHLNKRVDMIVCNCCAVQEFLKNQCQVDPDRLTVIYKGHETEWYQPKVDFDLHALLGISPDTLIAGCFANIRPVKGIDVLVRSFDLLRDLKDLHLVLVGSIGDPNLQSLVAQFNLQDRIHFLGFRSDVPDIMSRCQFTVMPSVDREGVPRAVVESWEHRSHQ